MDRPAVTAEQLSFATQDLMDAVNRRMLKHGAGAFASRHEAAGVLAEEYHEAMAALRIDGSAHFGEELLDIAVVCLFELASDQARNP